MKTLLFFAATICLFITLPASALYIQPELVDIPLKRLLANLSAQAKDNPKDANAHHQLARTHAMAYARKLGEASAVKTAKSPKAGANAGPWFGYDPAYVPFHKVTPAAGDGKDKDVKAAKAHLAAAIASYKKALAVKPAKNPSSPSARPNTLKLGLAWCQEQAGNKKAAIAGYREVAAAAWVQESKAGGTGPGPILFVETVGYLIPLLDATKDDAEIKDLEAKKKKLLALPRAITPLAVPLRSDATTPGALIDPEARVRFDLDGSGRRQEWQWITRDAAWLVYDPRNTRKITSGIQMFGSRTFMLFCSDAYQALALLDNDRDGALRGAELEGLALWCDRDGDGVSASREVQTLAEHGITSLSTEKKSHRSGILYSPAGVTFDNGTTRPTFDLILQSR